VRHVLEAAERDGRRDGSGGSTICCLTEVVNRELGAAPDCPSGTQTAESILRRQRILIVHAGGDSHRLPVYRPCGKIFIPVPGESVWFRGTTLFDRAGAGLPGFVAGRR